jgi:hypothetical protein
MLYIISIICSIVLNKNILSSIYFDKEDEEEE